MTRLLSDFSRNTPVATFAGEAGLSESRFSHLFRAGVGVPVRTYRRWLRLRAAIVYGLSGWDLAAAAHESGFSDQSEFSRACRTAFGAPPSIITRQPTSVLVGEAPPACALMQSIVRQRPAPS